MVHCSRGIGAITRKAPQGLHDLDEAELKPYFQLDRMIERSFACATRLFGLQFKPLDVPLYHEDCRAWEVTRNGEHVAVFIGDYFARGPNVPVRGVLRCVRRPSFRRSRALL